MIKKHSLQLTSFFQIRLTLDFYSIALQFPIHALDTHSPNTARRNLMLSFYYLRGAERYSRLSSIYSPCAGVGPLRPSLVAE